MDFRVADRNDWPELRRIFELNGGKLPDFDKCLISVAEQNGEIVGLWMAENCVHAGPVWVKEENRRGHVASRLNSVLESAIQKVSGSGYYTFPSTPEAEKLMDSLGMVETGWKVWKREF